MRQAVAAALLAFALAGCSAAAQQPAWALAATQLDAARSLADGQGVRVALLDTGIDLSLPALRHLGNGDPFDGEVVAYRDFLGGGSGPRDGNGHGSFVAGVLAGRPPSGLDALLDPGQGVLGLAPGVHLVVGRLCGDDGRCSLFALRPALEWAMRHGADVVGLSLGFGAALEAASPEYVREVRALLAEMAGRGILVVAAAGNTGLDGVLFPADDRNVLAVGAVGTDLRPLGSTAYERAARKPDLAAPGEAIVGPWRGGLRPIDGTSAAVPFVVAAAALLADGGADPGDGQGLARLRDALVSTARPLPAQAVPHDPRLGRGLLQAQDAWKAYVG